MKLKDQLFNSLPAGKLAFSAMLRLLDIVETRSIPTASVECARLPRLLVNPDFVAEHANTPEKLAMLVLHELHHVLLGHTRRFDVKQPLDNFVFDCVINAMLCRLLPDPEHIALLTDFYSDAEYPVCLLRPPQGWLEAFHQPEFTAAKVPLPPALQATFPGVVAARKVYTALYSNEGASYDDIRSLFPKALCKQLPLITGLRLLGGHDHGNEDGTGNAVLPLLAGQSGTETRVGQVLARAAGELQAREVFVKSMADVISGWPAQPQPFKGELLADMLRLNTVKLSASTHDRQCLSKLILRIADEKDGRQQLRDDMRSAVVQSPIRSGRLSRKEVVGHLLGNPPLLLETQLLQPIRKPMGEKVHVYLDVSGSIENIKGVLYRAVLEQKERVHADIHLFSTVLADVSLAQLRQGVCKTTGGTDVNCVFNHARQNKVKRALIITDGWVGRFSEPNHQWATTMKIAVAYTPSHDKSALKPVTQCDAVLRLQG